MTRVTGLLLAGGKSRRLGQDKRLIPYRGVPLVHYTYCLLRQTTDPVFVLVADARDREVLKAVLEPQARFLFDPVPGEGPFGALAGALAQIPGDYGLLLSVDLPRLTPRLLQGLVELGRDTFDAVIPLWQGRPQVTCALYHQRLAPLLAQAFRSGERSITGWLQDHREILEIRWVEEPLWQQWGPPEAFQGVNTPQDLKRLEEDENSGPAVR